MTTVDAWKNNTRTSVEHVYSRVIVDRAILSVRIHGSVEVEVEWMAVLMVEPRSVHERESRVFLGGGRSKTVGEAVSESAAVVGSISNMLSECYREMKGEK